MSRTSLERLGCGKNRAAFDHASRHDGECKRAVGGGIK